METAIVKQSEMPELTFADVKKYFCEKATDKEVGMFIQVCKGSGLNPFKREAYLTKYGDAPATIITGYEVYLKRAERSGKWNGYKVYTEGVGIDMKAIIEVYRKDWDKPFVHEVYYEEYVQNTKEGKPNKFWREKPRTMLKKVCIAQGMRLAFPDELGGLPYTKEELNDIETADYTEIKKETKALSPTKKVEKETGMNLGKEPDTTETDKPKGKGRPKKTKGLPDEVNDAKTHEELNLLWKPEYIEDNKLLALFKDRRASLTEELINAYIDTIKATETIENIAKLRKEIGDNKYIVGEPQDTLFMLLDERKSEIG